MGLLNKLKNVLFEEEEIEIPEEEEVKEVVSEKKEAPKRKEPVKMTFDGNDDILSDRELFKAEPTFNFPSFDEREFESVKQEDNTFVKQVEPELEVKTRVRPSVNYDTMERRSARPVPKEVSRPKYKPEPKKVKEPVPRENRKFKPSPVISPVYGVLDKNYKKEDVVVRGEEKKTIDVDSVRKKAFGTLEEDIEKTLSTPMREFYPSPEEDHFQDLLESSMDEVIPVNQNKESIPELSSFNIEEESIKLKPKELEVLDQPVVKKSLEEKLEDETLENDLFDLIDSMYETREDGESL